MSWFNGLFVKDNESFFCQLCSKMITIQLEDLSSYWKELEVQKAKGILDHPDHILLPFFLCPLDE